MERNDTSGLPSDLTYTAKNSNFFDPSNYPGMVARAFNISTWEAKVARSLVFKARLVNTASSRTTRVAQKDPVSK